MKKFHRFIRYAKYWLIWLFIEKPRGIDFHMRQRKIGIHSKNNNGYALSPSKAVTPALEKIKAGKDDCLIDIGCGKGAVLYSASRFNLKRIAGIEIEKNIYKVAVKNFRRLKLSDRIELFNLDALEYKDYDQFNIYYLFNPFTPPEMYREILKQIFQATDRIADKNRIFIISYGACEVNTIIDSGKFYLFHSFLDSEKDNIVRIFKYIQ